MSASQPCCRLNAEERVRALDELAELLASTFDGEVSTAAVHEALRATTAAGGRVDEDEDGDAWRLRVMDGARAGDGAAARRPELCGASQAWVCPMCETRNWTADARMALRRRPAESSRAASLAVAAEPLRCECCGYDCTAALSAHT
ncbi:hypothetical protein NESM_000614000 [Novymonas esmeraldas]|uniref:Uncharacterized protein n=1 Tax=Novymonas esmeraldas TaxID=1808958 RepID=A0AAW0ERF9_9TRYP